MRLKVTILLSLYVTTIHLSIKERHANRAHAGYILQVFNYNSTISQFAEEIRTNDTCKGLVLLFDIHGKDDNASDISIGTRNKSTIQPMVRLNPGWVGMVH